ncbi:hypothetical protein QYM18_23970 [Ectopseudomonas chengduensis]|nr:hypothetical protein [Pseudomonas chengduensis]WKC37464.1 hypothetical protein QYM18_23970 [Pseudomonas chengduensis]
MISKRISQGNHDDGAELDGRLYYRVSTAFHLITVSSTKKNGINLINIDALKSHPISYWSVLAPLLLVGTISYLIWMLIILKIQPEYFAGMLSEQIALKWLWLLISTSLVYLSLKTLITGPISDHKVIDVKIFGIYFGNAALGTAATYTGLIAGAIFAHLTLGKLFQSTPEYIQFIKFGAFHLAFLFLLYLFYITLLPLKEFRFHPLMAGTTFRILLLIFFLSFFSGRALDVLKVFKPELFG